MNFEQARFNMVEQQIRPWDVLDQKVLDVIMSTPREEFVPAEYRNLAFSDTNIPLGHGEVMLQPNVEGRLLQALDIKPSDTILQIGTGSGYVTACLAKLGQHVHSIDTISEFTQAANQRLAAQSIENVQLTTVQTLDDEIQDKKYDAIALSGSVNEIPEHLRNALNKGGRLFAIVGSIDKPIMEAILLTRLGEQQFIEESLFETALPPLSKQSTQAPHFEL